MTNATNLIFGPTQCMSIIIKNMSVYFYTIFGSATKDSTGSLRYLATRMHAQTKMTHLYEGRAPWDEKIEENIKRKKAIPMNIPTEVLKIAKEEFQHEQSEFESPLPSEAIPGSSAAVGDLPSEQIPVSSAAVGDLPSEQSAMDDVPQQSQTPSGTVTGVISEDQMAVQSIKLETYEPEPSTAENVLDMMSQEGSLT